MTGVLVVWSAVVSGVENAVVMGVVMFGSLVVSVVGVVSGVVEEPAGVDGPVVVGGSVGSPAK